MSEAGGHVCICGKRFDTFKGLEQHTKRSVDCRLDVGLANHSRAVREIQRRQTAEHEGGKRARSSQFQDAMRYKCARAFAKFRFLLLIESSHVDKFKHLVQELLDMGIGLQASCR